MRINKSIINVIKLKDTEKCFWSDKTYIERLEGLNILMEKSFNNVNNRVDLNVIRIKKLHDNC